MSGYKKDGPLQCLIVPGVMTRTCLVHIKTTTDTLCSQSGVPRHNSNNNNNNNLICNAPDAVSQVPRHHVINELLNYFWLLNSG